MDPVVSGRKECLAVMYPDHVLQESDVADVHCVPERDQRYSLRRFPRRYRVCVLLVLTLFGLHLLGAGSGAAKGNTFSIERVVSGRASVHTGLVAGPGVFPSVGLWAVRSSGCSKT